MSNLSKDIISDEDGTKSLWDKLNLSSNILCSVPYDNYRINVYEHVDNFHPMADSKKKRYFYAPVALLDPESATCYPSIGGTTQLRFRIELWNENLDKKVAEFINELAEQEVKPARVQVIPFENVMLSKLSPCNYYQVPSDWIPYQQQKSMWFTVTSSIHSSGELLKQMRTKQDHQFTNLQLLFKLTSRTSMPILVFFSPNLMTNQLIDLSKDQNNVVVFDAYRTLSFDTINGIVTYAGTNVNIGSGMDISKGIFNAPVAGVYSFNFNGHTQGDIKTGTQVYLQLNGQTKTTAHTGISSLGWIPISCSVILQLKSGDNVFVVLDAGFLYDNPNKMFTHFSGRLLYLS